MRIIIGGREGGSNLILQWSCRYDADLNENDTFHSLMYRQSDLDHSSLSGGSCGSASQQVQRSMLGLQLSSYQQRPEADINSATGTQYLLRNKRQTTRNTEKVGRTDPWEFLGRAF